MNAKTFAWTIGAVAIGVVAGGVLLYYGRDLPGFRQAHLGFDRTGS